MRFFNIFTRQRYKKIFKKNVTQVSIEFNSDCNRKCHYCPHSLVQRDSILLSDQILEKIFLQLKSINYENFICLNIYNEPLLHADRLFYVLNRVKDCIPRAKVSFSTNGDFLNIEMFNSLVEHKLHNLVISLHHNRWDPIKINESYLNLCRRLDWPVSRLTGGTDYLSTDLLIKDVSIHIFSMNYVKVGSNRANLLDSVEKPMHIHRSRSCRRPRFEFTVYYDGSVYPCCQFFHGHPAVNEFVAGNIVYENMFDIYRNIINGNFCAVAELKKEDAEPCLSCGEMR